MKDETILYAWYGEANDPAVYTMKEVRERLFKGEPKSFERDFLNGIESNGEFRARFAIYTRENKSPF